MLAARKIIQSEYQSEAVQLPVGRVRKKAKSRKNPWGRYLSVVTIVVVVAILIIGRYAQIARTNYEIARYKSSVTALERENAILQINVASLKAPGRVQEIAVTRLGMQLPEKVYYASAAASGSASLNKPEAETGHTVSVPWGGAKAEAHGNR